MNPLAQKGELFIRLGFFIGILIIMALWEILAPRRPLTTSKPARWVGNLGLVLIDSILVRLIFPITLMGVAFLARQRGLGAAESVSTPFLVPFMPWCVDPRLCDIPSTHHVSCRSPLLAPPHGAPFRHGLRCHHGNPFPSY